MFLRCSNCAYMKDSDSYIGVVRQDQSRCRSYSLDLRSRSPQEKRGNVHLPTSYPVKLVSKLMYLSGPIYPFILFSFGVNGVLLTHYEAPKHVRRLRRRRRRREVPLCLATRDSPPPHDEKDAPGKGRARLFRFTVARLLSSISQSSQLIS